jgi:PAS domain S-box-containing protein/putative nucleotidyltransferase with HDIG domain
MRSKNTFWEVRGGIKERPYMNVLIVDDITDNILLLKAILEAGGHNVVPARNGKEALDRLKEGKLDLIISDILMPVMDGFELCKECKINPEWRDIPFVFYTATYTEKKDEEFALSLGADRFVIKPEDPEKFLEIVREALDAGKKSSGDGHIPIDDKEFLAGHDERVVRKLEKKMAEMAKLNLSLIESEKKYRLLAENIQDVIFVLDMDMKYKYVSPSVKFLRGFEPEEALKQRPLETMTSASWEMTAGIFAEEMEKERNGKADPQRSRTIEIEVLRKDGTTVWTEVQLSMIRDENNKPTGILGVTRDITEHKKAEEALKLSFEKLRKALGGTVQAIAMMVEMRDPYTAGHQRRVASLAYAVAEEMGFESDRIEGLRIAATIHDIGKISIPAEILSKSRKLTNTEFNLIKSHPKTGYEILKEIEFPWPIAQIAFQHHEKMDGSGYPNRLKGDEILMESRILTAADVIEAMASHRPYRPALGIDAALDEINKNRGRLYDPEVVDACLRLFKEKEYKLPA